jgi:hypothetical protein
MVFVTTSVVRDMVLTMVLMLVPHRVLTSVRDMVLALVQDMMAWPRWAAGPVSAVLAAGVGSALDSVTLDCS